MAVRNAPSARAGFRFVVGDLAQSVEHHAVLLVQEFGGASDVSAPAFGAPSRI